MKSFNVPFAACAVSMLLAASATAQAPAMKSGANTDNPDAPFFIDLGGLDFKTSPPTRDPRNPKYSQAIELPDGVLPASSAQGNFIIGPTPAAAAETVVVSGGLKGQVTTFEMSSATFAQTLGAGLAWRWTGHAENGGKKSFH